MLSSSYSEDYNKFRRDSALLEAEMSKAFALDRENPANTMETQSGDYAYWAILASKAEYEENRLKAELKGVLGAARELARKQLEKPTKDQVDDYAHQNPIYAAKNDEYLQAQLLTALFKKAEEALKQRKDMLQSINSRQKAEWGQ